MPQLGFFELIAIFIVALLVFGPKKLPDLGKSLGRGLREFRKATDDLKSTWEEQVRDAERSVDDVKQTFSEVQTDLESASQLESPPEEPVDTPQAALPETTDNNQEVKPDGHPS
jgi:TatA/E family protein of Tat protein translocase